MQGCDAEGDRFLDLSESLGEVCPGLCVDGGGTVRTCPKANCIGWKSCPFHQMVQSSKCL